MCVCVTQLINQRCQARWDVWARQTNRPHLFWSLNKSRSRTPSTPNDKYFHREAAGTLKSSSNSHSQIRPMNTSTVSPSKETPRCLGECVLYIYIYILCICRCIYLSMCIYIGPPPQQKYGGVPFSSPVKEWVALKTGHVSQNRGPLY